MAEQKTNMTDEPRSSPFGRKRHQYTPLPSHTHCSGSGYIRGTYRGLTTELCTVRLTEVSEFQREETGLWEKNEQEVYTGQWMLCQLNREFPAWLTI